MGSRTKASAEFCYATRTCLLSFSYFLWLLIAKVEHFYVSGILFALSWLPFAWSLSHSHLRACQLKLMTRVPAPQKTKSNPWNYKCAKFAFSFNCLVENSVSWMIIRCVIVRDWKAKFDFLMPFKVFAVLISLSVTATHFQQTSPKKTSKLSTNDH